MRLGLVSTAKINGALLKAPPPEVEIVAVASRDAARAQAYATENGIERSHGSYDELLADEGVDAVYISLPNGMHHEWTLKAIDAGKHVLVEKPYSRRSAEVEEAWDAADRAGVIVMEAFMWRHHPQAALARSLVEGGAIGRLRHIRTTFSFPLLDLENIRMAPGLDGGALMDVGCYCISGARLLGGEPERVYGEQVVGPTGVDVDFYGTLRFPNDVVGQFDASFTLPERQRLEATGEGGTLVLEAPWRADWGGRVLVNGEVVDVPEADPYALELSNLAAAVAGEGETLLGRADALAQARVIESLYRSAESGEAVQL
ncbi:MAG TPA: Gfo/Idh/MocA family oxidoreductase [Gaiellaceae bacterium]|nr:Gfo/Idh/MocA family oxidoreductase [Gaiellaceae bacterium]